MMRFFREAVQPQLPRDALEGAIKGIIVGAFILMPYDFFSPIPRTLTAMAAHSRTIVNGYKFFVFLGILCGLLRQLCNHDHPPPPAQQPHP